MFHIKKNDIVFVIAGKDKGKKGKVLKIYPEDKRAVVEGINYVKKATRKTREDQTGGMVQRENPIQLSNLMVFCGRCNRRARTGITKMADGTRMRFCKKCKEMI